VVSTSLFKNTVELNLRYMNLTQIELLTKKLFGKNLQSDIEPARLFASQSDSAGGSGKEKTSPQDQVEPQASDRKREKETTGKAQKEEIVNKAKDENLLLILIIVLNDTKNSKESFEKNLIFLKVKGIFL